MLANARPHIIVGNGDIQDLVDVFFINADTQHGLHTCCARTLKRRVGVIQVVEVAVRVDQQEAVYMVCVWRSDCSAPAR